LDYYKRTTPITTSILGLLSVGITVIGSILASAFAVGVIIFKGNLGNSMGLEFIPCLGAPIPGLIGYFLSKNIFNRRNLNTNVLSIVSGIGFAVVVMVSLYSVMLSKATYNEKKFENNAANEMLFFKAVLAGKYSDEAIINHYSNAKFTRFDRERELERKFIQDILYEKKRIEFSPHAITVLIDVLKSDVAVVGYLVDQPETSIEVKMKTSESQDEYAVLPMSKNPDTPPEILLKLAAHESLSVSGNVSENKSAPSFVKQMHTIHYLYRYPDSVGYANTPLIGTNSDEEKLAWTSLSRNKRANVRVWVASNNMAPKYILSEMANDSSEDVLDWLILNNSTPKNVKQKIAVKRSLSIDEIISRLVNSQDQRIRYGVAQSNIVSPEILAGFWKNSDDMVLDALAGNPKTPIETLKLLSQGSDRGRAKDTATKAIYRREHKL
jgi:hypothetical protein